MTPIRQFIITNFAKIVIGLSLAFFILELNQNIRTVARELVFIEV